MPLRLRRTPCTLVGLAASFLLAAVPACGGDEAAPTAAGGRRSGGQGGTAGTGQSGGAGTSAAGNGGGATAGAAGAAAGGNGGIASSGNGGSATAGNGGGLAAGNGGSTVAGNGGNPSAGSGGGIPAGSGGNLAAGNGAGGTAGGGGNTAAGNAGNTAGGTGGSSTAGSGGASAGNGGGGAAGSGGSAGQAGGPNFDACDDPLIQPPGWQATTKTWLAAFSSPDGTPMATYPQGVGFPIPLGAQRGGYTVIPFTPTANTVVDLTWDPVQSNPGQGYPKPRPADLMFIGISRCPGDLRHSDQGKSGNPWLQEGCRRLAGGASLVYRSSGPPSNDFVCRVEPGVVHYLTVAAVDTMDGLMLGEHTCNDSAANSALGCDVQARHTATSQ